MKSLVKTGIVLAAALFGAEAMAASMKCHLNVEPKDDTFDPSGCYSAVLGYPTATLDFIITDVTKPISAIIWGEDTQHCGSHSNKTTCTVPVKTSTHYFSSATILYRDGTWERISGHAAYESF